MSNLIYFYWRCPGMPTALDWYATSERAAREGIREWLRVKRLPHGFEIWRGR